jgi:hypothetical protein
MKLNLVINNHPNKYVRLLLKPTKTTIKYDKFRNENIVYNTIIRDVHTINSLKENIFYENSVIEDLETLSKLDKKSDLYKLLYNKIIAVQSTFVKVRSKPG